MYTLYLLPTDLLFLFGVEFLFSLCTLYLLPTNLLFLFASSPAPLSLSLCVSLVLSRSHDRGVLRCSGVLRGGGASRAISFMLLLGFECGRWRRVRQWKWKKGGIMSERRSRMGL